MYDFVNRSDTHDNDGLVEILETRIMKGSRSEIPEAWERASPVARVSEYALARKATPTPTGAPGAEALTGAEAEV